MEIVWDLNNIKSTQPSILTIGTFDGVHLGHQVIIDRLNRLAKTCGGASTLITFEPHPQLIIPKDDRPEIQLLTTIDEKIELLQKKGLDRLVITNFTPKFAATEPESFVRKILLKRLAMQHIVIGHDHAFGRNRVGRIDLLKELGTSLGFSVEVVEPIQKNGDVISSTKIRNLLQSGDVTNVRSLLGRRYSIRGQVIEGDGRGRDMGFPTANLRPPSQYKLIPGNGVYAGKGIVDEITYDCLINIGFRPTFESKLHSIEVHLIGFNDSLYEREIEIQFTYRIRDELRFNTPQELIEQMEKDKIKSLERLDQCES
jgi:riboflavin kinase/FMN adenylyltransferase